MYLLINKNKMKVKLYINEIEKLSNRILILTIDEL